MKITSDRASSLLTRRAVGRQRVVTYMLVCVAIFITSIAEARAVEVVEKGQLLGPYPMVGAEPVELLYTANDNTGISGLQSDGQRRYGPFTLPGMGITILDIRGRGSRGARIRFSICKFDDCESSSIGYPLSDYSFSTGYLLKGVVKDGLEARVKLHPLRNVRLGHATYWELSADGLTVGETTLSLKKGTRLYGITGQASPHLKAAIGASVSHIYVKCLEMDRCQGRPEINLSDHWQFTAYSDGIVRIRTALKPLPLRNEPMRVGFVIIEPSEIGAQSTPTVPTGKRRSLEDEPTQVGEPNISGTEPSATMEGSPSSNSRPRCRIVWNFSDSCSFGSASHKIFVENFTKAQMTATVAWSWTSGVDRGEQLIEVKDLAGGERRQIGCSKDDTHPFPRFNTYHLKSCR
jgi:hypothetical protein